MISKELVEKIKSHKELYFNSDFTEENFEELTVEELYEVSYGTKKLIVTKGELKDG
jgi:hypothetical protein